MLRIGLRGIKIANFDKLGLILGAFILLLIGVVLIQSIADSVYSARTLRNIVNESIAIASGVGQTANVDLDSVSYFGNDTNSTDMPNIDIMGVGGEVNWTRAGVITVAGGTVFPGDSNYNISYKWEGSEYVTNNTARTLLSLIVIFFAIAIVLVGYNLVMKSFGDL